MFMRIKRELVSFEFMSVKLEVMSENTRMTERLLIFAVLSCWHDFSVNLIVQACQQMM